MSEDDSTHAPDGSDKPSEKRRSWLDRLSSAFSGEPSTRDDLVELLRDAQSDGLIGGDTLKMMEGAIAVADLTVGDVMVPRAQMVSLPVEARFLDLMKQVVESGHSRFPVHGDNKDEILGILLAKDLLRGVVADNGPGTVRELLRPAVLIPESKKLNLLLKEFRLSRNHMAIVVDEYGGTAGVVTVEDLVEEIVGEIDDEYDPVEVDVLRVSDDEAIVDAGLPIDDLNELFGTEIEGEDFDTVGGLVLARLGRIAAPGDEATSEDGRLALRVLSVLGRRIKRVRVRRVEPAQVVTSD